MGITADVVVVGGGLTGLSAALVLAEAGQRVVLLEARTLGSGSSSRASGHISEILDTRYARIESGLGTEAARLVRTSCREGMEQIARWVDAYSIDCAFERLPGYLHSEHAEDAHSLAEEHVVAARAGCRVEHVGAMSLPFTVSGLRFENQAQLDMGPYLRGLERAALAQGVRIFEQSHVVSIEEGPGCSVSLENGATVRASFVILATREPFGRALMRGELQHTQSYAVAVPDTRIEGALFRDTSSNCLRNATVGGEPFLIVGGEHHRPRAHESTDCHVAQLMSYVRPRFGDVQPAFLWSSRLVESTDGLPHIGRTPRSDRVYAATGFGGDGLTLGTFAAMMLSDLVRGEVSPYEDLYASSCINAHESSGLHALMANPVAEREATTR